jgi:hypothetical protein
MHLLPTTRFGGPNGFQIEIDDEGPIVYSKDAGDIDRRHVPVHGQVGSVDRRGYPAGIGGGSLEGRVG